MCLTAGKSTCLQLISVKVKCCNFFHACLVDTHMQIFLTLKEEFITNLNVVDTVVCIFTVFISGTRIKYQSKTMFIISNVLKSLCFNIEDRMISVIQQTEIARVSRARPETSTCQHATTSSNDLTNFVNDLLSSHKRKVNDIASRFSKLIFTCFESSN